MRYERLLRDLGDQGAFDLATVVQLYGEPRQTIHVQLHRWAASGKVVRLRRGMYAFPPRVSRSETSPAAIANALVSPSYLSIHWALGYYGLIPEMAVTYTSVTSRGPTRFENAFGVFTYRHVQRDVFFGSRLVSIDGARVAIAAPEKALVDLWYLEPGPWDEARMESMRFQGVDAVDAERLIEYTRRTGSDRAMSAADTWIEWIKTLNEGGVEL